MSDGTVRHAGDLLSAHLDGELDHDTDRWVVAHVADCAQCAGLLADLERTRSALRGLPRVDGTPFVEGFLARHRAAIRAGLGFVGAATVVLGLLALTAAVAQPRIEPDVDAMVTAHRRVVDEVGSATAGTGSIGRSMGEIRSPTGQDALRAVGQPRGLYSAPHSVPSTGAELVRLAAFEGRDLAWLLYRHGDALVSVYEQPGVVAWNHLTEGSSVDLRGRRGWLRVGTPHVVVGQVGHLVVTVVAEDQQVARAVAASLPARTRDSSWDRLHNACQRFVSVFSLGG